MKFYIYRDEKGIGFLKADKFGDGKVINQYCPYTKETDTRCGTWCPLLIIGNGVMSTNCSAQYRTNTIHVLSSDPVSADRPNEPQVSADEGPHESRPS